ncbi:hypothetical protein GIB67_042112, partial [Kingdonia uniflora]
MTQQNNEKQPKVVVMIDEDRSVIECPNTPTNLRKLVILALKEMRQNKCSRRQVRDWEPQGSSYDDSDEVEDIIDSFGDASEPNYYPEEGSIDESQPMRTKSTGLLGKLPFKPGCMGSESVRIAAQQGSHEDPLCELIAGDDDELLLPIHEEWPEELERELSVEDPNVIEQS